MLSAQNIAKLYCPSHCSVQISYRSKSVVFAYIFVRLNFSHFVSVKTIDIAHAQLFICRTNKPNKPIAQQEKNM